MNLIGSLPRLPKSLAYRAVYLARRSPSLFYNSVALNFPGLVKISAPAFIVGCQRSGTTILTNILGRHRRVMALMEPIELWARAYPVTDIRRPDARLRGAKLVLTAEDADPTRTAHLRRLLWTEMRAAGKRRLVDKNPWYSFRIGFLRALFPDARFLHVIRHGVEVARSIEQRCLAGKMWVRRPYVWELWENYARQSERYTHLLGFCDDYYSRALLQWKMSLETIRDSAAALLPPQQYHEVRYEELLDDPAQTCARIVEFIGEPVDPVMQAFAAAQVKRRSPTPADYPPVTDVLVRDLLRELDYG